MTEYGAPVDVLGVVDDGRTDLNVYPSGSWARWLGPGLVVTASILLAGLLAAALRYERRFK